MNSKWITMVIAIVFVALVVSIPTGYVLLAEDPDEVKDTLWDRGSSEAKAFLAGDDVIALYVNDMPISTNVVNGYLASTTENIASVRSAFERALPRDECPWFKPPPPGERVVVHNKSPLDGVSTVCEGDLVGLRPRHELWSEHGIEVVTLAGIIKYHAVLATAKEAGFTASEAEVIEAVSAKRSMYEMIAAEHVALERDGRNKRDYAAGPQDMTLAYINEVGAEKYWSELAPEQIRRNIVIDNWKDSEALKQGIDRQGLLSTGTPGYTAYQLLSLSIERETATNPRVEFTDEYTLDATLEEALAYLEDEYALEKAQYEAWPGMNAEVASK